MFSFTDSTVHNRKKSTSKATFRPLCEALEQRDLMSVVSSGLVAPRITAVNLNTSTWHPPVLNPDGLAMLNGLPDPLIRSTALADYQRDGSITRNDMIDILFKGTTGFTDLTNTELASLEILVNGHNNYVPPEANSQLVAMPDYVQNLSSKVLANVNFGGSSPAQTLQKNVNNFFLGQMHPNDGGIAYAQVNEPLWNSNPSSQDVHQTSYSPDNWLLTSLEEVVSRYRVGIENMIFGNGDNTYTVGFYNGTTLDYLTVDNMLPNVQSEAFGTSSGVLWVPLILKAYAQESAAGGIGSLTPGVSSYAALGLLNGVHGGDNGNPAWAFAAITGPNYNLNTGFSTVVPPHVGVDPVAIYDAWTSGHFVVVKTLENANLVGTTGADPLFYPEDMAAYNSQGIMPHPRWYALVNWAYSDTDWFTVTENGSRFLQVAGFVMAANFDRWEESAATISWSSQSSAAAPAGPAALQTVSFDMAQSSAQPVAVAPTQAQRNAQQGTIAGINSLATVPSATAAPTPLSTVKKPSVSLLTLSDAAVMDIFGSLGM